MVGLPDFSAMVTWWMIGGVAFLGAFAGVLSLISVSSTPARPREAIVIGLIGFCLCVGAIVYWYWHIQEFIWTMTLPVAFSLPSLYAIAKGIGAARAQRPPTTHGGNVPSPQAPSSPPSK